MHLFFPGRSKYFCDFFLTSFQRLELKKSRAKEIRDFYRPHFKLGDDNQLRILTAYSANENGRENMRVCVVCVCVCLCVYVCMFVCVWLCDIEIFIMCV